MSDISVALVFPQAGVANYGGGTVDARYNWWGDASGSGASVVGARWGPFLTSPVTQ